jgi:DNA-binding TFAR19-related protein (PDSD5 family)
MMTGDRELEYLRHKKLLELQKASLKKLEAEEKPHEKMDAKALLSKVFVDRAWEVWNTASSQYPLVMENLSGLMARMIDTGTLQGPITGEQLYWLLRRLGLRVRLKTSIKILESGEMKTIAQKLKEE